MAGAQNRRGIRAAVARLRRDTRGSAMTETVIMLPVFILIWSCIIFAYQAFERQIDVMQATRRDVWQYATNNCEGSVPSGTTIEQSTYSLESYVDAVISILGHAYAPEALEQVVAKRTGTIDEPALIGEDTVELRHRMRLLCNEETQELGDDIHYEAWAIFGLPELL